MKHIVPCLLSGLAALTLTSPAFAGPAPEAIHYQGVLRDAAGEPLDGDYEMIFRLYDAPSGGTLLYTDEHLASGFGAVTADGGLFGVAIGTGASTGSLGQVFTNHIDVWIELEVEGETLSPRSQVRAVGHALNATTSESANSATTCTSAADAGLLDGLDSSQFLRSDQSDTTSGVLTAGELRSNGDLYLNDDVPDGDGKIHFSDSFQDVWFGWDDGLNRLRATYSLDVEGSLYVDGDITLREGLTDSRINFHQFGPSIKYLKSSNKLQVDTNMLVVGDLEADSQIVMNHNGPNANQDIEFFHDQPQFERFQWDATAERFEVSDTFHAFGDLSASGTKPFVQNHPYRSDLEIVYTAMEGNEVTTFTRGSSRLVNGEARIPLEESFGYVTNPELGLSAHLTPRGPASVLYAASVSTSELVVRSVEGDDVAFDFVVYGLRIGYEDYPVYRSKRAESFAPPPGHFAEEFADEPELAEHTALSRYRRMAAATFGRAPDDMPAATALREAIGMREPGLDFPQGSDIPVREMNRRALAAQRQGVEPVAAATAAAAPALAAGVAQSAETRAGAPQDVYARSFRPSAGDIARLFPVGDEVEAGDVLVIDAARSGGAMLARFEADTAVFGVVAAEPGLVLGAREEDGSEGDAVDVPVAVSGVVLCKVDATWGAIRPGDLLQTSPTPGHAMRADEPGIGSVLGKALEPLDGGTGLIRVLVTLR